MTAQNLTILHGGNTKRNSINNEVVIATQGKDTNDASMFKFPWDIRMCFFYANGLECLFRKGSDL